jgi:hypothetical protein
VVVPVVLAWVVAMVLLPVVNGQVVCCESLHFALRVKINIQVCKTLFK